MILTDFQQLYSLHPQIKQVQNWLLSLEPNLKINGLSGSSSALVIASLFITNPQNHIIIADDAEAAAYLYNDLKQILSTVDLFYFPSAFK